MRQMSRITSVLVIAVLLLIVACNDSGTSTGGVTLDANAEGATAEPFTGVAPGDDVNVADMRVLVSSSYSSKNIKRLAILVNTMTLEELDVIRINTVWDNNGLEAFEVWYVGGPEPDVLLERIDELR